MYKEAGLFDPIADSIQVTEFTIKDAYSLRFFENNSSRLPKWCNDADNVKLPYCQIKGCEIASQHHFCHLSIRQWSTITIHLSFQAIVLSRNCVR
ncbi:hypothetical protein V6N13_141654 [Hibiscus sabdariffa]